MTADFDTPDFEPTADTTVRVADRGSFDRAAAYAILDEAFVAHVGFASGDRPFVIPMVFGRDGDRLLLHGSVATRLMRTLDGRKGQEGAPVCVTVTHVDGLVIARSQFHHSVNYRSVVILGTAERLRDEAAERALEVIVDHVVPGRSAESRPGDGAELRQTMVLSVPIEEASVKVRSGGPVDDERDLDPNQWAGVLPLSVVAGEPVADDLTGPGVALPESLAPWRRP